MAATLSLDLFYTEFFFNTMKTIAGIDVYEEGQGHDVILMIHGWPDTYRLWNSQVEALKSQYRCIRFTLPGFEPTGPRRAYGLIETVEIIHQIVQTCSPDQPVTLMIHDWGCFFGYHFARLYPEMVSRVIALDIGDAGSRAHNESLSKKSKLMKFGYQAWLAAAWRIGGGFGNRMTRFMAGKMRAPADSSNISVCMNYPYFIQWTGAHGSYKAARTYHPTIPMLFIYGSRKPFQFHSPKWAQEIDDRDDSRVVAMDAGHWMMCDEPEQFNEIVLGWLAQ